MPDGKGLQLGTSHNLGQNFSIPFDIKYLNKDNKEEYVWQTSWGVSWRLMGALIMVHGDDKGLILPPAVAPIQIIIVPIYKNNNQKPVKEHAHKLKEELESLGYRAFVDDRDEYTAGWKYNEWEMKGVPLRINIGQRDIENNTLEIVRRDNRAKKIISFSNLITEIHDVFDELVSALWKKALTSFDEKTMFLEKFEDLKTALSANSGFVLSFWCGDEACELKIKDDTGADIRVIPFDGERILSDLSDNNSTSKTCVYCGAGSKQIAIFAKAY
jgi:prolyl-tRNA synthetase